jgi:hypothetical protein
MGRPGIESAPNGRANRQLGLEIESRPKLKLVRRCSCNPKTTVCPPTPTIPAAINGSLLTLRGFGPNMRPLLGFILFIDKGVVETLPYKVS